MFIRPAWDPTIHGLLEDWSFVGDVREKPGYRFEDQALRWASSRGTMMSLFNTSKPNYSRVSKAIQEVLTKGGAGPFAGYRPPDGQETDIGDPFHLNRMVKKAAIWFGDGRPKKADRFWEEWRPEKGRRV